MKLTEQTKHYLIVGGGLILAVIVAIVVYKKYQVSSQASQAAADQANSDDLAYLEASSMDNAYGDGGLAADTAASSIALPSASSSSESLAQELQQIEELFGYGNSTSSTGSGSTGGSGSGSSGSGSSSSPSPTPPTNKPIGGVYPVAPQPTKVALEESAPQMSLDSDPFREDLGEQVA